MSDLNKKIGIKMKAAREKVGLSLRDVASIAGRSYSSVHSYETGRNAINVDVMREICNIYGVNYIDILQEIYFEERLNRNK